LSAIHDPASLGSAAQAGETGALAGTLIQRSGAYLRVFEHRGSAPYLNGIESAAGKWRKQIDEISAEEVTVAVLQSVRIGEGVEGGRASFRPGAPSIRL